MDIGYVCMRPKAIPTHAPLFEVADIEFHERKNLRTQLAAARRVLWSTEAAQALEGAIRAFKPDIIHLHNYAHQLSSSILAVARGAKIPTIATAHDYKLICPAYTATRDGAVCFQCAKGHPIHCFGGACLHGSHSWSAVAAAEAVLVRSGRYKRIPNCILAPSQYMATKLRDSWLHAVDVPVHVLRNPIEAPPRLLKKSCEAAGLYVGRLSAEKGLDILVRAAALAQVPVTIVGDGSERSSLESQSIQLGAPVRFAGFLQGEALENEWSKASFFVMTPRWPENAPLALLEALARGLPALVSDIGGLPELVNVYGGRLIRAGDAQSAALGLKAAATGQLSNPDVSRVAADLSWETHIHALKAHYEDTAGRAH
jgi:glycosyltransferase involved in cell wall biosynthesis